MLTDNQKKPDYMRLALVHLMRGVVDSESDPALWQGLLNLSARIRDYVALMGLELVIDEAEGYAFLRQEVAEDGEEELPHLVKRIQLGFPVSLLLALLRKRLAENDAAGSDLRPILTLGEIRDMVRAFTPDRANEAKALKSLRSDVKTVVELGFLRPLRAQTDRYEIRRLLKHFVDAQWLASFDAKLAEYRGIAAGEGPEQEEA